jgi:hypothetical protein
MRAGPATFANGHLQTLCHSVDSASQGGEIDVAQLKTRMAAAPGRLIGYARVV